MNTRLASARAVRGLLTLIAATALAAALPAQAQGDGLAKGSPASQMLAAVGTDAFAADVVAASARQPVAVLVYATWCGHCRVMMPKVEQVAQRLQGRMRIVRVDVDAEPALLRQLQVRSVPTVVVYQGGEAQDRFSGGMEADALERRLLAQAR
ncbi:MAG: thioredoxin family protein [Hydrogenophaga sp.]|jgi:thioredoxin-like negative regulator of GroEL|nr:thioredoxin family protein [Hydrogenophaga sp.]